MYAVIGEPGSSSFNYHGPDTKANCLEWLNEQYKDYKITYGGLCDSVWMSARVISNKEVEQTKYRDGSRVYRLY